MASLLFISRKAPGTGGMQQLHEDLWKMMQLHTSVTVRRVRPYFAFDLSFPVRLLFACMMTLFRRSHIHLGDASLGILGFLLKKFGASHISLTACGLDVVYPAAWYQRMLHSTLPSFDHIACISRATANEVRNRGVSNEKISVIPCGLWPDEIPQLIRDRSRTLLTVGRLVSRKGVAWFLENVFVRLHQKYPEMRYKIIGSGNEESLIKKVVQERGLGDIVTIRSATDAEREEAYASSALFVMPNIPVTGDMEGFGIVCIEASARGLPVVASRLEGIEDAVIEGKTGRFFEPKNADDCVRVIEDLLKNPLGASVVSQTTRTHFNWNILATQYTHVFGF